MDSEFGVETLALWQSPLQELKGKPGQQRWIVATFEDDVFHLAWYVTDSYGVLLLVHEELGHDYERLWKMLARQSESHHKWWLIGWRVQWALYHADFVGALESGDVFLPESKRKAKLPKRSGKLTQSPHCIEVDVVCGANKIKVLDWLNFGVPAPTTDKIDEIGLHVCGHETLSGFLRACNELGIDASRTTAAQLGWVKARQLMPANTLCCNTDDQCRELERAAYFGGRNECFHLGDCPGTVYSLDVKSCYAHLCAWSAFPFYLEREYRGGLPVESIVANDDQQWIADVTLTTEEPDYPVAWLGSQVFPIGTFRTALCWPELFHALNNGRIRQVHRAARYLAAPVLRNYAQWFQRGKDVLKAFELEPMLPFLKFLFNASLGYSARRKYEWLHHDWKTAKQYAFFIAEPPDYSSNVCQAQVISGQGEWLRVGGEPREAVPFLHATICSYGRAWMLRLIEAAGRANVLYVDTDGLLVTAEGAERLQLKPGFVGDGPGLLCERFPPGKCRIQGQKNYRIGNRTICAGLVKSRHAQWHKEQVLTTSTGSVTATGAVKPHRMQYSDVTHKNEIVD